MAPLKRRRGVPDPTPGRHRWRIRRRRATNASATRARG